MTDSATSPTAPLVTREALSAFTQRLVEHFDPQNIILFGSQARGEARWDSGADILVVMPFEGKPRDRVEALLAAGAADFPLDLHLRQPEEMAPATAGATPIAARPWIMASCCMVSWTPACSNGPTLPSQCAIRWWMNGSRAPS